MSQAVNPEYATVECLLRSTDVLPSHHMLPGDNTSAHSYAMTFTCLPGLASGSAIEFLAVGSKANRCLGYLVYWPEGKPATRCTSVISSRLGRKLENQKAWFQALRAVCARKAVEQSPVLNVAGTAAGRFLPRATELFATPRVDVIPTLREGISLPDWWNSTVAASQAGQSVEPNVRAFVSPRVAIGEYPNTPPTSPPDVPIADLLLGCMGDEVIALHVRKGGHAHQLIKWRLDSQNPLSSQIKIAIGANLNTKATQDELLQAGAVGWLLYSHPPRATSASESPTATPQHRAEATEVLINGETYLTHCTRRRVGPWPKQSENSYLDDLILDRKNVEHSPFSALQRIVRGRQLIASEESVRGQTPVVSFTSVPLDELQSLRVFRSHRGRWDFEPYGISIRRSALESLRTPNGERQPFGRVAYATTEEWEQLGEKERPFFQLNESVTRSGNVIDWTTEQEWRTIGDIDLMQIAPDDAIVFVPNDEQARLLQPMSRWPVIVLENA